MSDRTPARGIALYGYLGSGNIGNDATLETVLEWLGSAHPSEPVSCITIAPEAVTARYGLPASALAYAFATGRNRLADAAGKVLGRLVDVPRSLVLAGRYDAVVVPGMGVLEDTLGTRPWGMPYWLFLIALACRLRRRAFVLLDVGANRSDDRLTRLLYDRTVALATHVSYRDVESATAMARADDGPPGDVAPDLAFAHPGPARARPQPGRVVVGVMEYHGHRNDPVQGAELQHRYIATLAAALAELVGAGHHVVLVGGDRVDTAVAQEVALAVRGLCPDSDDAVVVRDPTTFTELAEQMSQAEVVIASRFHNLICALRLGQPTVSVGYAGKSRVLMGAVGAGAYCQDIETLDAKLLVAQVGAARRNADALRRTIGQITSRYASDVRDLLERVGRDDLHLAAPTEDRVDIDRR